MKAVAVFVSLAILFSTPYLVDAACNTQCVSCGKDSQSQDTCANCVSGFVHDVSKETCPKCITDCNSCSTTDLTVCSSCRSGFYRSKDNKACTAYPFACAFYNANAGTNGECTSCKYGYGPTTDKQKCAPCADYCSSCTKNGAGKCDTCMTGYYRQSDKTCTRCSDNCDDCHISGAGKCDRCLMGYELSSNLCKKRTCKENCYCDLADDKRCDECLPGFTKTMDKMGCIPCNVPHCTGCTTPGYCTSCEAGYRPDPYARKCMNAANVTRGSFLIAAVLLLSFLFH